MAITSPTQFNDISDPGLLGGTCGLIVGWSTSQALEAANHTLSRLQRLGVQVPAGNRLERARKSIQRIDRFHVQLGHGDQATERLLAEASRTVFEQHLIVYELQPLNPDTIRKLQLVLTGPDIPVAGRHDPARDAQAELFAGVLFYGAGFRVDPVEPPDLMLTRNGWRAPVAVKRVTSAKNFKKRLRQGRDQLIAARGRGFIVVNADMFLSELYYQNRSTNLSAAHYEKISEWTDGLPLDHVRNPVLGVVGISTSFQHRRGGSGHDLAFQIHFHSRFVTWQDPAQIDAATKFGALMGEALKSALGRMTGTLRSE